MPTPWFLGAAVAALTVAACGFTGHGRAVSSGHLPLDTGQFASQLTLPSGRVLKAGYGTKWRDIAVALLIEGVPRNSPYGYALVGNHSNILQQSFIETPVGRAYFVLNERTPPAASGSTTPTFEYWIAVFRPYRKDPSQDLAYSIVAQIIGRRRQARAEVLELTRHWRIPK